MKVVVIMCLEEYIDRAKRVLFDKKAAAFSELEISGYKMQENDESDNWFASKHVMNNSKLIFTIVDDEKADEIINEIDNCGKELLPKNPVRAFVLSVDKVI